MSGTFSSNAVTVTFSGDFPAIQLTAQRKESFGHYEIFSGVFDAVIDYDSAGSFGDDLYIFADGQVVIFALRPFSNGIFATYASGQLPASFEAGQDFVVESPVDSSRFTLRVDREAFLLDEDLIFLAGSYTGPPGGGTVSTQRLRTSPGFVPLRIRRPGTVLFEFLNQQPVPSIAVRIDEIIPGETYILQGSYDFVTWTDLREMSFVFRFNVSIFWEDLDTFPGTGFNDDFYFRVITRE